MSGTQPHRAEEVKGEREMIKQPLQRYLYTEDCLTLNSSFRKLLGGNRFVWVWVSLRTFRDVQSSEGPPMEKPERKSYAGCIRRTEETK